MREREDNQSCLHCLHPRGPHARFWTVPIKGQVIPLLLLCNAKCLVKQQQVPILIPWMGPKQSTLLVVQRTLRTVYSVEEARAR